MTFYTNSVHVQCTEYTVLKYIILIQRMKDSDCMNLCSFETLKNGLHYLKHEESRRATGPLAFVKDNIATFLDALDTLRGKSIPWQVLRCTHTCINFVIVHKILIFQAFCYTQIAINL